MRNQDRQLSRRLKDAAPTPGSTPDFDVMWRRAEGVAHAANDDAANDSAKNDGTNNVAGSRRLATIFAVVACAAALLVAGVWAQRPEPAAPQQVASADEAAAPVAAPTDEALAEVADGQWDAPTDFLLAESAAWAVDDAWETMWDEPLDETL